MSALEALVLLGRAARVLAIATALVCAVLTVTAWTSARASGPAISARRDVGLAMREIALAGATVNLEESLGSAVQQRIAIAVVRDIAQSAKDFGRGFAPMPELYVLATRGSFALALKNGFGIRAADAAALAVAASGIAFGAQSAVVINWQNCAADPDLTVMRHELTHLVLHQIAGPAVQMPMWLDEGIATLQQSTLAHDEVAVARQASRTAVLVRQGRVSLTNLSTPGDWAAAQALGGDREYGLSAAAALFIRDSLGNAGLMAMLGRARDVGIARAFADAMGISLADFAQSFPQRYVATQLPRVVQRRAGDETVWAAVGFAAETPLHVSIDGADYHLGYDARADRDGVYAAVFGDTAPPGRYDLTITAQNQRAVSTIDH